MQKNIRSSKAIQSNKNINLSTGKHRKSKLGAMKQSLQIIRHNCKSDHLNSILMSNSPSKLSLYTKHYSYKKPTRPQKLKTQILNYQNKQNLQINNTSFSTYQVFQKFNRSGHKLPSIHEGSSYREQFVTLQGQKVIKAKQSQSHFLKQQRILPVLSQYRKSFEISPQKQKLLENQKGKPSNGHLFIPKYSHFRGNSSYKDQYFLRASQIVNAEYCIKNKDHLSKKNTYPTLYQKSQTHKHYEKKQFFIQPNENISFRHSSNEHYFPSSRVSTFAQYQTMYKNVFHKPFEEEDQIAAQEK